MIKERPVLSLSIRGVAGILGLSHRTIRKYLLAGKLKGFIVSRRTGWKIPLTEISHLTGLSLGMLTKLASEWDRLEREGYYARRQNLKGGNITKIRKRRKLSHFVAKIKNEGG